MGKTYYSSEAQMCSLSSFLAPYQAMLEYNLELMDGTISLAEWSNLHFKAGKGGLIGFERYVEQCKKKGDHSLDYSISTNGLVKVSPDANLGNAILKDLGYTTETATYEGIVAFNPQTSIDLYIRACLPDYNYEKDNIIIDGITYTILDYDYKDDSTIIVYFVDIDKNTLEKEIPMYAILSKVDGKITASDYLILSYQTIEDEKEHNYLLQVPVVNSVNVYTYTDKEGNTYNYGGNTVVKSVNILPLIPVKEGGSNGGYQEGEKLTATRYKKITSSWKSDGTPIVSSWWDFTGIKSDYQTYIDGSTNDKFTSQITKYKDPNNRQYLYKQCKWIEQRPEYKSYKKAAKKMGSDIRQQCGTLYDVQMNFIDGADGKQTREYIFDCYTGFFCPLIALRSDEIKKHPVSEFDTVYARLLKDTAHPIIAEYAKWSRYTSERTLDSDKDDDGVIRHRYFIEINKKFYRPSSMKALAKYLYKFFDLYNNEPYSVPDISFRNHNLRHLKAYYRGKHSFVTHQQGNYKCEHHWTSYKTVQEGRLKYRYSYGFNAQKQKQYKLYTITFTGKYDVTKEYQGNNKWKLTYKPIYNVKVYQCLVQKDLAEEIKDYTTLGGIPIKTVVYNEKNEVISGTTNEDGTKTNYDMTGLVLYTNPVESLGVTQKVLLSMEDTTSLVVSNITFADTTLNGTSTVTNADGTTTTTTNTKGTYAIKTDELLTATFYGTVDTTKLGYTAKVLEYTETVDGAEDTPPDASTDIKYDNFSTSFLSETETAYILLDDSGDIPEEVTSFHFYYQFEPYKYYDIEVNNYYYTWWIKPSKGHETKANSRSGLAPDSEACLPIVLSLYKELSLREAMIFKSLCYKQWWSYYYEKHVSTWEQIVSFLFQVLLFVINIFVFGGVTSMINYGLNMVVDKLGLDGILGELVKFAIALAVGCVLGVFSVGFVIQNALICIQNIGRYLINKQYATMQEQFNAKLEKVEDQWVELENAEADTRQTLEQSAMVRRLLRQELTLDQQYALQTNVVTNAVDYYQANLMDRNSLVVAYSTRVQLGR